MSSGGDRAPVSSEGRTPLVAGNWKMHKTPAEAKAFIDELLPLVSGIRAVDLVLCPPFTALAPVVQAVKGSVIQVFAQNMHHELQGAFTGEVAPTMLRELGVAGAIVGHSERRELFGESDRALALKVPAALENGLVPILCVGETEDERDAGDTERKLRHQVQEDLARVEVDRLAEVVIAYEPIWAIGTGRTATPEDAQTVCGLIRTTVGEAFGEQAAAGVRVQYGGSVKPANIGELMAQPDIDGALVGGASLEPDEFAAVVKF